VPVDIRRFSPSEDLTTEAPVADITVSDTLTWLKTYGTVVDNTSLVSSMLSRGQRIVLTGIQTTFLLAFGVFRCVGLLLLTTHISYNLFFLFAVTNVN